MARRRSRQSYENKLRGHIDASARKINLPYPTKEVSSIDWDNPEYAITPNDPRWILPPTIDVGASKWYQEELTEQEQIKVQSRHVPYRPDCQSRRAV